MVFTEIHVISGCVICLHPVASPRGLPGEGNGIPDIFARGLLQNKEMEGEGGNEANFTRTTFAKTGKYRICSCQQPTTMEEGRTIVKCLQ